MAKARRLAETAGNIHYHSRHVGGFVRDYVAGIKMNIQTARKDHKCDLCGKKIPEGARYWRDYQDDGYSIGDRKEHTNCEEFKSQPDFLESRRKTKRGTR
jgi:hypothetical protein